MVRHERPRGSPAIERLHHGRFHFNESARVQLAAQRSDDPAAGHESPPHVRIHQIQIALAIAGFHIFQPVPLFRQREQDFGQEREFFGMNAQFARPGQENVSLHAHDVAKIQLLEQGVVFGADGVFADVNLKALAPAGQVRESRFPHAANGHQTPGDAYMRGGRLAFRRQFLRCF